MRNFRALNANEIECRINTVSEKGVSLLLYKTARIDYAFLDEKFGMFGWQNDYKVIDGKMYCGIGVQNSKGEWIWKWNVGVESNTEAEKGQASDAMKRAGVCWGIGSELYSTPFIWISADKCNIETGKNGKLTCYDKFNVKEIDYAEDESIRTLVIEDNKGNTVFTYPKSNSAKSESKSRKYEDFPDQCLCEKCKKPLRDYLFGGKKVTISKHIGLSKTRYDGHIYCIECINQMNSQAS